MTGTEYRSTSCKSRTHTMHTILTVNYNDDVLLEVVTMNENKNTNVYNENEYEEIILNRLRDVNLIPKDLPQHKALTRASVLVPLFRLDYGMKDNNLQSQQSTLHDSIFSNNDNLYILLTKRPDSLRTHSGEVCFPGGKQDSEDCGDDVITAIRETYEEVGIPTESIQPLCRLQTVESYTGLCVTSIVGWIDSFSPLDLLTLNISDDEVEVAFVVPLRFFNDDKNLMSKHDVEWRGGTFELRTYHYTTNITSTGASMTFKIWGLTAYIAHQVAATAYSTDQ